MTDSDPARLLPLLLERTASIREEQQVQTTLIRELEERLRHIENERVRWPPDMIERLHDLEQWRRDFETAEQTKVKVKEPYTKLWWLGVGAVVVMVMSGFAVIMWRIIVAATTAGPSP